MKKVMIMQVRFLVTTAVVIGTLAVNVDVEAKGKRKPPPEAFEVCANQDVDAVCEMQGRRGETLTGTCVVPPREEAELVCRPDRHAKGSKAKKHGQRDSSTASND